MQHRSPAGIKLPTLQVFDMRCNRSATKVLLVAVILVKRCPHLAGIKVKMGEKSVNTSLKP